MKKALSILSIICFYLATVKVCFMDVTYRKLGVMVFKCDCFSIIFFNGLWNVFLNQIGTDKAMNYFETKNEFILNMNRKGKRYINASDVPPVIKNEKKLCVWCLGKLYPPARKWCSNDCQMFFAAFSHPQSGSGFHILLFQQDFKCAICLFSWEGLKEEMVKRKDQLAAYSQRIWCELPKGKRPEVDHIIPIHMGGDGIGLENVHVICEDCHTQKTKLDLSGRRNARKESVY